MADVERPEETGKGDEEALFGKGLAAALTSAEAEGIVPAFIGIWKAVFGEISRRIEDIWIGELSWMAMYCP